jgi:hypothetical protein
MMELCLYVINLTQSPIQWVPGTFSAVVKRTRLKMRGAVPPLPNVSSWSVVLSYAHGQLYLIQKHWQKDGRTQTGELNLLLPNRG